MQWAEPVVPQRFGLCRAVAFRLCLSDPLSPSLGQQQRGTGAVARGALNHPERRWRSNLQGSGVAGAVAGVSGAGPWRPRPPALRKMGTLLCPDMLRLDAVQGTDAACSAVAFWLPAGFGMGATSTCVVGSWIEWFESFCLPSLHPAASISFLWKCLFSFASRLHLQNRSIFQHFRRDTAGLRYSQPL